MTTVQAYDAIVIGSGPGRPVRSPCGSRKRGLKTALVEREHLGGTCVNDGCIPTKTLVASARAAHVARRAADWGVVRRRAGERRHEARQGAQGPRRRALDRGPRASGSRGTRTADARLGPCALHAARTRSR